MKEQSDKNKTMKINVENSTWSRYRKWYKEQIGREPSLEDLEGFLAKEVDMLW